MNSFSYKKMKFSEMPGFEGYKKALEDRGVFIEDRTVGFTVPESVDRDMYEELWVIESQCELRDLHFADEEDRMNSLLGEIDNAKIVECSALFAYGEWALVETTWQWLIVDNEYADGTDLDFYWCSSFAWPANQFSEVVNSFKEGKIQEGYWSLNTTDSTDSLAWMEWLIGDVLEYVEKLKKERE